MSHSQAGSPKAIASVEKARLELDALKDYIRQLKSRPSAPLLNQLAATEKLAEKAERNVLIIKSLGKGTKRNKAYVPPSLLAQRAVSVLRAGISKSKRAAASGKPGGVRDEELNSILKRITKETGLIAGRIGKGIGVGFECRNVFRAYLWFRDFQTNRQLIPEHIAFFRVDELSASRFSVSRHAIFHVLTERANAALRYYTAISSDGAKVLLLLARWVARHATIFAGKFDDRRLAFDASRGIFLPPCVIAFDGDSGAEPVMRFTRGSIPVRNQQAGDAGGVRIGARGADRQAAQRSVQMMTKHR